jgi:protein TonB
MNWRVSTGAVGVLLVLLASACARNPPPAAPVTTPSKGSEAGSQASGLSFDPQGADFTLWVNRFRDEVYRNWIIPQAALFGVGRGHADFEFVVERDGTMSALRLIKSSGTPSLDRAAEIALSKSKLLLLPNDYGPPRVTMQVSFWYNDAPPK